MVQTLRSLGEARWWQLDIEEAEALTDEALLVAREIYPPMHPQLASVLRQRANLHYDRGDFERAEWAIREALAIREKTCGPEQLAIPHVRARLASVLLGQQRLEEAERELRQALSEYQVASPRDRRPGVHSQLGEILTRLGRYEEAERELLAAHECLVAENGDDHSSVERSTARIVALYKAWNKPEEAARWRAETD
jgi:non-specific serine/threonine protein kinase/serine/threonine-protein kinase